MNDVTVIEDILESECAVDECRGDASKFYPFSSSLHALLFMLTNSPRPLVPYVCFVP